MIPRHFRPILLSVCCFASELASAEVDAESSGAATPLRLVRGGHLDFDATGNEIRLTITGANPHFWSQPLTVPAGRNVLTFDYFSTSDLGALTVRFRDGEDSELVLAGSRRVGEAQTWRAFTLDLAELPEGQARFHFTLKGRGGSELRLRNPRLRAPTPAELQSRKAVEEIQEQRHRDAEAYLAYLRGDHPATVAAVIVGSKTLRIQGHAPAGTSLVELLPHDPSHQRVATPSRPIELNDDGGFAIELPRFAGPERRDRALSRWRVDFADGAIASLASWSTRLDAGVSNDFLPKAVARGRKGLGGIPLIGSDDHPLFELGLHHATLNLVVDSVLSRTRKPGHSPWEFEGRTWFVNDRFVTDREATVRRLCARDIVVSGILLISNHPHSVLKHPDAEPRGTFAMPDLATLDGALHYRAAIALLAERFSRPDTRIANWIIHNEIDHHGTWTNMGDQPLPRYLECYARSSRIVYHSARLHDPHARVFISLTHHWNRREISPGVFRVRDIVDLWSELAAAEGEFDWGVAYHPYPENLRNPDTWDDRSVSFDFDTARITPKNLEVLPAYLGPDRPILLSEQGFNTPTLSEEDQKRQVAGIIYTFRKIRQLPSIEAYHLHRYQDMPDREGGLRFGLLDEHGNRKLAWDAYAALGTPAEAKHAAIADTLLPPTEPIRIIPTVDEKDSAPPLNE